MTQSGKKTYGIGRLFSSLSDKTVPSIYFLSLSLLSVKNHRSFSIMMEQVMPEIVKSSSKTTTRNDSCHRRKRGRPLGSNNQNRVVVGLSKYLQLGQATVKSLLKLVNTEINLVYLVFDGAFGNHNALQMARQGGLQLISTMRYDSALYFPYRGKYCGRGRRSKYGNRLNCRAIPNRYLKNYSVEGYIRTDIYQVNVWQKWFADRLNTVIIVKTNLKTGPMAHVILFSSDLELTYDNLIEYYQLRFQIEFNFRDAKQFWGLEDFMNIKKNQVHNAANLAMFMVNLSPALLRKPSGFIGKSVNDLKAWFRASKYVTEILKLMGEKPEPILINQLIIQASELGRVNHNDCSAQTGEIAM